VIQENILLKKLELKMDVNPNINLERTEKDAFLTTGHAARYLSLRQYEIVILFALQLIKNVRIGGLHVITNQFLEDFKEALLSEESLKANIESDEYLKKLYIGEGK
jgi:hypothetical protein